MATSPKFFVPREEILKLTTNSFEHRMVRLDDAVKQAKDLFDNADTQLVGTFESYAIVLTGDGKVFKAQYEEAADGKMHLLAVEALKAVTYAREAMPKFLRKEAQAATDLFLGGFVAEANKKVAQIAKIMDENTPVDDEKLVASVVANMVADRSWKAALKERTEEDLRGLLGESFDSIDANKLRVKFSKLYDGSITGSELEKYRGLATTDVGTLMGRMDVVSEQATKSVVTLRALAEKVADTQRETVAAFAAFVDDLAAHVRQMKTSVTETIQGLEGVAGLGRLYDALTEELLRFELAGAFAVRFTDKLANAAGMTSPTGRQ